jgi:hypothetical protein
MAQRIVLEGETGTPISRGEFAFRFLSEALPVPSDVGYDTVWLIAAHLLFNSASLDFLLEQERDMGPENLDLLHMLVARTNSLATADNRVDVGPWPLNVAMKFTDHIALRVTHYKNVLRPRLMVKRMEADGQWPDGYFLVSVTGQDEGRPLTKPDIWAALEKGLQSMEARYPVSYERYRPLLTNPDDFAKFVRWCRGPSGRVLLDQLSDDAATSILDGMTNTASQNQRLYRDLESDLRARRDALASSNMN